MSSEQDPRPDESGDEQKQREELGDAELFKAVRIMREVFERMGLDVVISTGQAGQKLINVSGPDSGLVVGKKGQTLDALHFLLNRILHRTTGKRGFIDIDVEGYRSRREKVIKDQAMDLAEQVRSQGVVLDFDPMSARERRMVHITLADEPGVRTESRGEGDRRYVQVLPEDGDD
ncbi:MAG: KH domain-containing protein [Deltaproteobacteria bacterium]|nr:KH domain-containing protein [Deltaproteobacteria bacterium]